MIIKVSYESGKRISLTHEPTPVIDAREWCAIDYDNPYFLDRGFPHKNRNTQNCYAILQSFKDVYILTDPDDVHNLPRFKTYQEIYGNRVFRGIPIDIDGVDMRYVAFNYGVVFDLSFLVKAISKTLEDINFAYDNMIITSNPMKQLASYHIYVKDNERKHSQEHITAVCKDIQSRLPWIRLDSCIYSNSLKLPFNSNHDIVYPDNAKWYDCIITATNTDSNRKRKHPPDDIRLCRESCALTYSFLPEFVVHKLTALWNTVWPFSVQGNRLVACDRYCLFQKRYHRNGRNKGLVFKCSSQFDYRAVITCYSDKCKDQQMHVFISQGSFKL